MGFLFPKEGTSGNQMKPKIEELISKLSSTRGFICECLIDQNKYIGNDPVGHACFNRATKKATTEMGTCYFCDSCLQMLEEEPERLTFNFIEE